MKTTTREFITSTQDGREVKIVATYVSQMTVSPYLRNYPLAPRDYISTAGSRMVAYVDGVQIKKTCSDPAAWCLRETLGVQKIGGMPIGFSDPAKIDAYNAFLADLMQEDEEVVAFRAAKEAKAAAKELEFCKQIVSRCEAGWMVETAEEANAKRQAWNNLHNEGGEGYVPTWYTREAYESALKYINDNERF